MVGKHNLSDLVAASALTSLVERCPSADAEARSSNFIPDTTEVPMLNNQPTTFPLKLMQVLSMEEYSDIIVWLPHGRAFAIVNPREFVSVIIPSHFKRVKYSSFTRKLHRWGFQRKLRGDEAGSYHHKFFQRDNVGLCKKMSTRQCNKHLDIERMPSSCAPVSMDSLEKSKQHRCNSHNAIVKKSEIIRQKSPQDLPATTQKHTQPNLCTSKLIDQNPPLLRTPIDTLSGVNICANVSSRQNKLDQVLVSQRLQATYRAAAVSRHALMMLQPQGLLLDRVGDFQRNPVTALACLGLRSDKTFPTTGNFVRDITSQDADLEIATNTRVQNNFKKIHVAGERRIGTMSLLSMMPPSA